MEKKEKKLFYFLLVSQIYCLILGGFNGGDKMNYLGPYFFHFLTGGCVWNCLVTIVFVLWKLRRPTDNSYFAQTFSLVVLISNLITMGIYTLGLIIGGVTSLTSDKAIKLVPIPTNGTDKIIHWWLYSPLWHLIAPGYFIYGFFHYKQVDLLKKKLKLTLLLCLVQPILYFTYCFTRSKISEKNYLEKPFSRGPYFFFSSKQMANKLDINRFTWKIILALFGLGLISLIAYFSLELASNLQKKKLRRKKVSKFFGLIPKVFDG